MRRGHRGEVSDAAGDRLGTEWRRDARTRRASFGNRELLSFTPTEENNGS
jgi:hypothetical protein